MRERDVASWTVAKSNRFPRILVFYGLLRLRYFIIILFYRLLSYTIAAVSVIVMYAPKFK